MLKCGCASFLVMYGMQVMIIGKFAHWSALKGQNFKIVSWNHIFLKNVDILKRRFPSFFACKMMKNSPHLPIFCFQYQANVQKKKKEEACKIWKWLTQNFKRVSDLNWLPKDWYFARVVSSIVGCDFSNF